LAAVPAARLIPPSGTAPDAPTREDPAGAAGRPASVDVHTLVADGQWLVAPWPGPDGARVLVIRQTLDHYVALSMQCTH